MKSIKEKQLLVKWAKAMNEPIDNALVEEVERHERTLKEVIESVKQNTLNDLIVAAKTTPVIETRQPEHYPLPPTLDELLESVQEESIPVVIEPKKEKTLAERAAEHIHKEAKIEEQSFQQPDPPLVNKELKDVVKKIKFLEQWLGKITATGPGGGEVDLAFMEMTIKSVTSPSYNATTSDYYIGVNYAGAVSIYLPPAAKEGKVLVIKDELGEASLGTNRYITIWPSSPDQIDSRNYAILAYDWGSLTLVYKNNMWRVI